MQDPLQPAEPLRQTFLTGYYGPAAATMGRYLRLMEDSIAVVDANMSAMKNDARPYLTLPFYLECERLLSEAEAECASAPQALLHVRRERIPVDCGLYYMWLTLTRNMAAGAKLPVERETLLKRYEQYRLEQMVTFRPTAAFAKGKTDLVDEIARMRGFAVFEQKDGRPQPSIHVPLASSSPADGDPVKVNWSKAAKLAPWFNVEGRVINQRLTGRMVHDGRYLYLKLVHNCDGTKLSESGDTKLSGPEEIWSGDNYELFFAARCEPPYRRLALNAQGKVAANEWPNLFGLTFGIPELMRKDWAAGASVVSRPRPDGWTVYVSIPLESIVPGGVKKGGSFYASFCRSIPDSEQTRSASSLKSGSGFLLTRLTQFTLK